MNKKTTGLPELAGSPKQIAWAETIRAEACKDLIGLRDKAVAYLPTLPTDKRGEVEAGLEIIAKILDRTSASEWIDDRYTKYDAAWLTDAVRGPRPQKPSPEKGIHMGW